MSNILIRTAIAKDAAILPDIERSAGAAFSSVAGLEWLSDDDPMSADHHATYVAQGTVWVAEADDKLIGFVTCRSVPDENCLHIIELSVASGQQGKGVGWKLMETVITHATANDMAALSLTTFRDLAFNEKFYQKIGFQTLGANELTPRLRDILSSEVENGLPADRRCAMAMRL